MESDSEELPEDCPIQQALEARAAALEEEEALAIESVESEMDHKNEVISRALYDLDNEDIMILESYQEEILQAEDDILEQASIANADFESEIEDLEAQRIEIAEEEADLIANLIA